MTLEITPLPVLGAILIGGQSRRMHGVPKHLLKVGDGTWFDAVHGALAPHTDEVVALGVGQLPEAHADMTRLVDAPDTEGPLAGMLAALRHRRDACWIIVACDQPLLTPDAVGWLVGQRGAGRFIIMPRALHDLANPFPGVYEPQALGLLESLIATGRQSPSRLADHPSVYVPRVPPELLSAWSNLNRPQDLGKLLPTPGDA